MDGLYYGISRRMEIYRPFVQEEGSDENKCGDGTVLPAEVGLVVCARQLSDWSTHAYCIKRIVALVLERLMAEAAVRAAAMRHRQRRGFQVPSRDVVRHCSDAKITRVRSAKTHGECSWGSGIGVGGRQLVEESGQTEGSQLHKSKASRQGAHHRGGKTRRRTPNAFEASCRQAGEPRIRGFGWQMRKMRRRPNQPQASPSALGDELLQIGCGRSGQRGEPEKPEGGQQIIVPCSAGVACPLRQHAAAVRRMPQRRAGVWDALVLSRPRVSGQEADPSFVRLDSVGPAADRAPFHPSLNVRLLPAFMHAILLRFKRHRTPPGLCHQDGVRTPSGDPARRGQSTSRAPRPARTNALDVEPWSPGALVPPTPSTLPSVLQACAPASSTGVAVASHARAVP